MPLTLSGQVFNTRGDVVPDATIEIWQTNHHGHYDLEAQAQGTSEEYRDGQNYMLPPCRH